MDAKRQRVMKPLWGASRKFLQVIDCHAGGEPARVVVGGLPRVPGDTVAEKRNHMMAHMDSYRKLLLLEPRGYPCQNADFIVPASHPEAAYGFVIAEQNKIYPMMSGHNCICVVTALLETGMVPMEEPITRFALEALCCARPCADRLLCVRVARRHGGECAEPPWR